MSVDVRELAMSLALPFRLVCLVEEPAQFLDVEVLARGPRIEPMTERLSVAFEEKEAVETARGGDM